MAITLNLPAEVEERLINEAARKGLSVEQYLVENTCLTAEFCHRRTPAVDTSADEKAEKPNH